MQGNRQQAKQTERPAVVERSGGTGQTGDWRAAQRGAPHVRGRQQGGLAEVPRVLMGVMAACLPQGQQHLPLAGRHMTRKTVSPTPAPLFTCLRRRPACQLQGALADSPSNSQSARMSESSGSSPRVGGPHGGFEPQPPPPFWELRVPGEGSV